MSSLRLHSMKEGSTGSTSAVLETQASHTSPESR
jgi:hypothetical protein